MSFFFNKEKNDTKKIWNYVKDKRWEKVLHLLKSNKYSFNFNSKDPDTGHSILHHACKSGAEEVVNFILELRTEVESSKQYSHIKINIDSTDSNGNTPLHLASLNNYTIIVESLLKYGADPYIRNKDGKLPSHLSKAPIVEELFHRDNTGIFSPVVQSSEHFFKVKEPITALNYSSSSDSLEAYNNNNPITIPSNFVYPSLPTTFKPSYISTNNFDDELSFMIVQAAKETASVWHLSEDEFETRRKFATYVSQGKLTLIEKYLTYDPELPIRRVVNIGNISNDGNTMIHIATFYGYIDVLKLFKEKCQCFSSWVIDLQGRTPLHIAAEKNNIEMCIYLKKLMKEERNIDPVGSLAPVDLSGTTPIGWAKKNGKPSPELINVLVSFGDKSIFSPNSYKEKSGKSPCKISIPLQSNGTGFFNTNITNNNQPVSLISSVKFNQLLNETIYASSEGQGWPSYMEDRIKIINSISKLPTWSLYCVFDGHGGSFCSEFLSSNLEEFVQEILKDNEEVILANYANDIEFAKKFLYDLCILCENKLKFHPRMKVRVLPKSNRFECLDSSGTTGLFSLVTPKYIITANVGDSRAIILSDKNNTLIATPLSTDHKFTIEKERERAFAAGANLNKLLKDESNPFSKENYEVSVSEFSAALRMSRSFGDFFLKQKHDKFFSEQPVIAIPEITIYERTINDGPLILACDGVFDVMENAILASFVDKEISQLFSEWDHSEYSARSIASNVADKVVEESLKLGGWDNLSVILVFPGSENKENTLKLNLPPPVSTPNKFDSNFDQHELLISTTISTPIAESGLEELIDNLSLGPSDDISKKLFD